MSARVLLPEPWRTYLHQVGLVQLPSNGHILSGLAAPTAPPSRCSQAKIPPRQIVVPRVQACRSFPAPLPGRQDILPPAPAYNHTPSAVLNFLQTSHWPFE